MSVLSDGKQILHRTTSPFLRAHQPVLSLATAAWNYKVSWRIFFDRESLLLKCANQSNLEPSCSASSFYFSDGADVILYYFQHYLAWVNN